MRRQSRIFGPWLLCLTIVGTALSIWRLDARPLENQDEAVHAAVSLEMVRSGDWVSPTFANQPYFRKPPLKIWLTAILFELQGVDRMAVRLPSAVAGILVSMLVGVWMAQWTGNLVLSFITGAAVTCMRPAHFHAFRTGEMDGLLTLFVALGFYAWWRATRPAGISHRWILLVGLFLGLGVMTKGFAALLPVPALAVHAYLLPRERRPRGRALLGAVAVFLLVVLPWHVIMTAKHGAAFWDRYVGVEVVSRVLETQWGSPKPVWWYVSSLPVFFFPWVVALPSAVLWCLVRTAARRRTGRPAEDQSDTNWLLLLWFLLGFVAISLVRTKAQSYLLSLYPAALLLIGSFLSLARAFGGDRLDSWCYAAVAFFAAAWLPRVVLSEKTWGEVSAGPWSPLLSPWLLGAAGVLLWFAARVSFQNRRVGMSILVALFLASVVMHVRQCTLDHPLTGSVRLIGRIANRPARVVCYRTSFHNEPTAWFHLLAEPGIDPVITYAEGSVVERLLKEPPHSYLLAPLDEPLPPAVAALLAYAAREGGYGLWERRP